MAADPGVVCATFHSIKMTPADGPVLVNNKSCISTTPASPSSPTCTITCGFSIDMKAFFGLNTLYGRFGGGGGGSRLLGRLSETNTRQLLGSQVESIYVS